MAIKRIWHGWTTHENADIYQDLLHREVFPGIEAKKIKGLRCIELLRQDLDEEVEFVTIMTFDHIDNVIHLQGKDYEKSYVPDAAQKVLSHWDQRAAHFDAVERRSYLE